MSLSMSLPNEQAKGKGYYGMRPNKCMKCWEKEGKAKGKEREEDKGSQSSFEDKLLDRIGE